MNNRGICIIRIVEFFVDETMKSWWKRISKDTSILRVETGRI